MRDLKLFVLFLVLAFASCADKEILSENAGTGANVINYGVTIDEAQKSLEQLLSDMSGQTRSVNSRKIVANRYSMNKNKTRVSENEISKETYVFNFADSGGFAIMSADTRLPELYVLTDSGQLDSSGVVKEKDLACYLSMLNDYINTRTMGRHMPDTNWYDDSEMGEGLPRYTMWRNKVYCNGGLCKAKWGQGDTIPSVRSFNMYCPLKDDMRTFTGCVPVALGQLMTFYKYPQSYKEYTFDWNAMEKVTAKDTGTVAMEQVARLLWLLGLPDNLCVRYGQFGYKSDAEIYYIPKVLKKLGYSQEGVYGKYSTLDAIHELNNNYPIVIEGFTSLNPYERSGHDWLGHGLMERYRKLIEDPFDNREHVNETQREWYILCNCGWNGKNDGYYLSEVFDMTDDDAPFPESTRVTSLGNEPSQYNYRYSLQLIKGIRK